MPAMLNYATVGINDPETSLPFYDGLLGSIGMAKVFDHPSGGRIYGAGGALNFGVLKPYNGGTATAGNGAMVAFNMDERAEVDAFHAKGLELGGSCEGAPGERGPGFYFAYFRDLEGNKICGYKLG